MTSGRVVVLGHRGGRGEGWPAENSLAAFARALDEGADGVELDVRLTADGVPVVFHDPQLPRGASGAPGQPVQRVAAADLPALAGGARIPRLVEALDVLRGRIVNVEIKSDVAPLSILGDVPDRLRLVRATAAAVKRVGGVEVVFSSFDPLVVASLAAIAPRLPRAILVGASTARAATALALAMKPAVVAVHLEQALCTPARVERLARAGLRLAAWTVNDPARAAALVALGVSWIITDSPGAMVAALATRR
ncbi:MAG TPA: glycerophosphodiester phosphodiesterase [Labilithrix sp.]|nr:glycerophosphodiester phosphodiesterase [Labilithrix sp.]